MRSILLILILLLPTWTQALPTYLVHPVSAARTSSAFGTRIHPVLARKGHHHGIDIPCPTKAPVRVLAKGIVLCTGRDAGYGKYVIVFHGSGWSTLYAHLSSASVRAGERLSAGEVLGLSGSTGRVTGPHLHFELRKYGTPVDPIRYVPFSGVESVG
jgi:murein DD-endopeptidase MepM/ murein hydrolase activator NlpD